MTFEYKYTLRNENGEEVEGEEPKEEGEDEEDDGEDAEEDAEKEETA